MTKPAPKDPPSLHDRDFCLWVDEQAALLEQGRMEELDVPHLIKAVDRLGQEQKEDIVKAIDRIVSGLLKFQVLAGETPGTVLSDVLEHQCQLEFHITSSPSLRPYAVEKLAETYPKARDRAAAELDITPETFPETCPYALDDVLDQDLLFRLRAIMA